MAAMSKSKNQRVEATVEDGRAKLKKMKRHETRDGMDASVVPTDAEGNGSRDATAAPPLPAPRRKTPAALLFTFRDAPVNPKSAHANLLRPSFYSASPRSDTRPGPRIEIRSRVKHGPLGWYQEVVHSQAEARVPASHVMQLRLRNASALSL